MKTILLKPSTAEALTGWQSRLYTTAGGPTTTAIRLTVANIIQNFSEINP